MKITKSATEIVRSFGSSTTYNNSGGLLPSGTDTIQEAIDAIAGSTAGLYLTVIRGGQGTIQNLSTLGATETIDLGNANYFYGTLNANCAISTTGWTTGKDSQITLEITGDGVSTPTVSGVTWIGSAPGIIGAGSVEIIVLLSRDGGATIYGAIVGGSGPSSGHWEILMAGGVSAPPEPLENGTRTDWLWAFIP